MFVLCYVAFISPSCSTTRRVREIDRSIKYYVHCASLRVISNADRIAARMQQLGGGFLVSSRHIVHARSFGSVPNRPERRVSAAQMLKCTTQAPVTPQWTFGLFVASHAICALMLRTKWHDRLCVLRTLEASRSHRAEDTSNSLTSSAVLRTRSIDCVRIKCCSD